MNNDFEKVRWSKSLPFLQAEVINPRSHYFGEAVYLSEKLSDHRYTWYLAGNLQTKRGEFKVFFKEDELEIDTGLDYE